MSAASNRGGDEQLEYAVPQRQLGLVVAGDAHIAEAPFFSPACVMPGQTRLVSRMQSFPDVARRRVRGARIEWVIVGVDGKVFPKHIQRFGFHRETHDSQVPGGAGLVTHFTKSDVTSFRHCNALRCLACGAARHQHVADSISSDCNQVRAIQIPDLTIYASGNSQRSVVTAADAILDNSQMRIVRTQYPGRVNAQRLCPGSKCCLPPEDRTPEIKAVPVAQWQCGQRREWLAIKR